MTYKFQNIKFITLKLLYGAKKTHYECEKSIAILDVIYVPHNIIMSLLKCYKVKERCYFRLRRK